MSAIGVVHTDFEAKGGDEAVCMPVSEARQGEYEVTLLTLADLDELNAYVNTNVHDVTVERAVRLAPWLHERYGLKSRILQNALLGRHARSGSDEFDLLVSLDNREHIFHSTVEEDSFYERPCTTVGVALRRRSGSNSDELEGRVSRRRSRATPRWRPTPPPDLVG